MKPATIAALEKTIEGLLRFLGDVRRKETWEAIEGLVALRHALQDEDEGEEGSSDGNPPGRHFGPD